MKILGILLLGLGICVKTTAFACVVTDGQLHKQGGWRWDRKSQGLFFDGNPEAPISWVGGRADTSQSGQYVLSLVPEGCSYQGVGQDNWRWDKKSQTLVFAGNQMELSPAGGKADISMSGNYVLYFKGSRGERFMKKFQKQWYWDSISQGMFYGGNGQQGPAKNSPSGYANLGNSGHYILEIE